MFRRFLCLCVCCSCVVVAHAETIRLANGDTLNVTILESTDTTLTFEHPTLGRLTVPRDNVAMAQATPEAPPAGAPAPVPAPAIRIFGVPIMTGWQRRLEVAADASRGNSETSSIRVGFDGRYEDDHDRWIVESDYYRATADHNTDANKFDFDLTRDWLLPDSPWFIFLKSRYDYDDFDSFRHRATASSGVGYQFVKDQGFDLLLRLGGGGNYAWDAEDETVPDQFTPEGLVGVEGVWRIDLIYPLEFRNTLYPDLERPGEFRNLSEASLLIPMDVARSLYLKLGLENEYVSRTLDDAKNNDIRYAASLVIDF